MITGMLDGVVIARRDLTRSLRQKSQLLGSVARPILWLFILGTGLRSSFSVLPGGVNYTQYIFPGILAMNVLFASITSGTTIIWDREFGFLKEIMVAPVSRASIVFGKTLSGSTIATLQGTIVLVLFPFVGLKFSLVQIILIVAAMFMIAFSITSLGILIAARMSSFEGFGTINNFLVMPMFFLSGALYPVNKVPLWLKPFITINPVTYGVDLLRGVVLRLEANYLTDIGIILLFAFLVLACATYLFRQEK
ncbi:ABC transporter permease [Candidatus Formimonas warabiya]|nr:ABC transporter permease [Candidatus Formimonas warabiya]